MPDVLRHVDSPAVLKGPATAKAVKTNAVQMERLEGGKKGADSHGRFQESLWKSGRPWLEFGKVEKTKRCFRGTVAGGGCQKAKEESVGCSADSPLLCAFKL